jgi:hypothetical protein
MSGPRITSGDQSLQDAATPPDFMAAIGRRFGAPVFDLAAHRLNKKHALYFAPAELSLKYDLTKGDLASVAQPNGVRWLVDRGARRDEAEAAAAAAFARAKKGVVNVRNWDEEAYAFDAFKHDWHALSRSNSAADGKPGLLWLNCEWADVDPWAARCALEAERGASITLLTHVAITAWFSKHIAGRADCYPLLGRMSFDGKNLFPKDCMISHFHPEATGSMAVWDWKRDVITKSWRAA